MQAPTHHTCKEQSTLDDDEGTLKKLAGANAGGPASNRSRVLQCFLGARDLPDSVCTTYNLIEMVCLTNGSRIEIRPYSFTKQTLVKCTVVSLFVNGIKSVNTRMYS